MLKNAKNIDTFVTTHSWFLAENSLWICGIFTRINYEVTQNETDKYRNVWLKIHEMIRNKNLKLKKKCLFWLTNRFKKEYFQFLVKWVKRTNYSSFSVDTCVNFSWTYEMNCASNRFSTLILYSSAQPSTDAVPCYVSQTVVRRVQCDCMFTKWNWNENNSNTSRNEKETNRI